MFTDSENMKKLVKQDNGREKNKNEEIITCLKKIFGNSFYGASVIPSDFMIDPDIFLTKMNDITSL